MVLLFTATMALCLPTAANYVISDIDVEHAVKGISHTAAILMFLGYIAYLVFQVCGESVTRRGQVWAPVGAVGHTQRCLLPGLI